MIFIIPGFFFGIVISGAYSSLAKYFTFNTILLAGNYFLTLK